jgi:hypothetical protein
MVVSGFFFNLHLQLKKAETIVWPTSADHAALGLGVSVNGLDPIVRFKGTVPLNWGVLGIVAEAIVSSNADAQAPPVFDRKNQHVISYGLADVGQQASDPPKLTEDNSSRCHNYFIGDLSLYLQRKG